MAGEAGARPAALPAANLAKGALRRLAMAKLEPTPENFAKAYAEEGGLAPSAPSAPPVPMVAEAAAPPPPPPDAQAWASLMERMARGLDRSSRQWTAARRKESLQRVLDGSRSDPIRLLQRARSLVAAWESGAETGEDAAPAAATPAAAVTAVAASAGVAGVADASELEAPDVATSMTPAIQAAESPGAEALPSLASPDGLPPPDGTADAPIDTPAAWQPVVSHLHGALRSALPVDEPRARELADELQALADRIATEGATPALAIEVARCCQHAQRLLAHRHHLVESLARLTRELGAGIVELAEDESWARGQAATLATRLAEAPTARAVRAAEELLADARRQQVRLKEERKAAQDALKSTIRQLLSELSGLSEQTGRFHEQVGRHADAIAKADSLQTLAGVVRDLVEESRAVQALVSGAHDRLAGEHAKASELEGRVRELEGSLRRLADEVSTDALTQVANRRGLQTAFETERARIDRDSAAGGPAVLAVGLIDIDNFKRLNDSLGHAAGDKALQALAANVRDRLRPVDTLARFGGEEFVVLLPGTGSTEAQQALTRLQRSLTASLFMHEQKEVFVTFSAGVTAWRPGEPLETALERADEALYEAKRTGKNRTCVG